VCVYTDVGLVGTAEAARRPFTYGETQQSITAVINDVFAAQIIGQSPLQRELIHSRMNRTVGKDHDPVPLHYIWEGSPLGEPVVLSGSLGSNLRMWDPQVSALIAAGYRVLRYDHRGHGSSPVPAGPYSLADLAGDVVELLDHVNVQRAHFVGLSLGRMVAMWLAQHGANRLTSLSLCCTSAQMGPASGCAERAATVRKNGTRAVSRAFVERWFTPRWRAVNPQRVRNLPGHGRGHPGRGLCLLL